MQQAQAVWRTVTRTGTGLIVADDTTEGMPVTIEMQGWTKQDSTTGAQIFDISKISGGNVSVDGNTIVLDGYSCGLGIMLSDFLEGNTQYTASAILENRSENSSGSVRGVGQTTLQIIPDGKSGEVVNTFTTPENLDGYKMYAYGFAEGEYRIKKLQIQKGTTATAYEQYTGGKPSPSPDYQQEIRNSGHLNEETQRFEYIVKLDGANMCPVKTVTISGKNNSGGWVDNLIAKNIPVISGKNVYATFKNEIIGDTSGDANFIAIFKTEKPVSGNNHSQIYNEIKRDYPYFSGDEIEIDEKTNYVTITFGNRVINGDATMTVDDVMLSYVEDIDFVQYEEPQTVTVTSDRPISKWDRLELRDGVYGWGYKTKKLELTGEENWLYYVSQNINQFYINDAEIDHSTTMFNSMSDKFVSAKITDRETQKDIVYTVTGGVGINTDVAKTAEDWKAWLAQNSVSIIVKTKTEEFVPLSEEEQAMLQALKTYFPTTVIENDDDMFTQIEYKTRIPEQEV